MITFENVEIYNFDGALRGMRNSWESWHKSDSKWDNRAQRYVIGPEDYKLAMTLSKAGADHGKYLRQIMVSVDITAPLYFYKQFDQYKVGSVTNSTSTMHKISSKPFSTAMFSVEDLEGYKKIVEHIPNEVDETKEIWMDYPLNDLYMVSDYGRVKRKEYTTSHDRTWGEKIYKNIEQHDRYLAVSLKNNDGSRKLTRVHRMVAQTFLPNPDDKPEVNHKDGNRQNNHVSNLEWSTRSENALHAHRTNLQAVSSAAIKKQQDSLGKSTKEQREIIKEEYQEGYSTRQLAEKHGLSLANIKAILQGRYFVEREPTPFENFTRYIQDLEKIRELFLETKDKKYWRMLIQMLPDSFNQTRTTTLNYQVLKSMYHSRKNHRLSEWREFAEWVESLPYAELITLKQPVNAAGEREG